MGNNEPDQLGVAQTHPSVKGAFAGLAGKAQAASLVAAAAAALGASSVHFGLVPTLVGVVGAAIAVPLVAAVGLVLVLGAQGSLLGRKIAKERAPRRGPR